VTRPVKARVAQTRIPLVRRWSDPRAQCLTEAIPLDLLYQERPGAPVDITVLRACARCPVRYECLESAMDEEGMRVARYGIRGGLTPRERIRLARKRKKERQAETEEIAA
jgi:hypothetical protein